MLIIYITDTWDDSKFYLTMAFCWCNFDKKVKPMGGDEEFWVLAVFISVFLLLHVVTSIREHFKKRKLPKNHMDRRTNRKLALNILKSFLGIKEKDYGDNPMKHQIGDDGALFK